MAFEVPEYTIEDFKDLLYPIFEVPEGESIMTSLGESHLDFPEFKVVLGPYDFGPGEKDKVIRYIACVYDMKSPFVKDFHDVNIRKIMAATYVGFESTNQRFDKHVERMMLGGIEPVVDMVIRYCRSYNQPDYSFLVAIWDDYYRTLKLIQLGEVYDYGKVKKMREDINELSTTFLTGDDAGGMIKKLYQDVEKDSLLLRPEDIAQKLEDGLPAITDEEISGYRADDLTKLQPTGEGTDSESRPGPVSN